jgi:uncharacterized protein (DUF433 family)
VALDEAIFGLGIYSPREAARLIGGNAQEILRWTRGSGPTEPLWNAHYQFLDDTSELSFLDLIEVRVVKAFRKAGVSLQAIRFAIDLASQKFGLNRPLSTRSFKLLGGEITMTAIEDADHLVSLSRKNPGQGIFAEIVKQSLNDLEYEDEYVVRWRPSIAQHVVIDPKRQFGAPILDEIGVSTATIFREYNENNDAKYLSRIYEVPLRYINDAIKFEQHLLAG